MLPLVGSTIVPPGFSSPLCSAASIMRRAMRSFTEPPGLKYSTLARTVAFRPPLVTLLSRTSGGVLPTRLIIESWYRTVVSGRCKKVWSWWFRQRKAGKGAGADVHSSSRLGDGRYGGKEWMYG